MAGWNLHQWTITYEYPEEGRTIKAILDGALKMFSHSFSRSPYTGNLLEMRGDLIRVELVPWKSNTLQVRYASANGSKMLTPLETLLEEEATTEPVYSEDLVLRMI